jgi:hypothetical protein
MRLIQTGALPPVPTTTRGEWNAAITHSETPDLAWAAQTLWVACSPGANDFRHAACGTRRVFMLPNSDDIPANGDQQSVYLKVSGTIAGDLRGPVGGVRGRSAVVLRTAMPEAAIQKDRHFRPSEDQISRAPDLGERTCRDPVPEPQRMYSAAERQLGSGVAGTIRAHGCAHGLVRRPRLGGHGQRLRHDH